MKSCIMFVSFFACISSHPYPNVHYDYIIVGSGSAGSVLTTRLSKNPSINVLLLEAGEKPLLMSSIPFLHLSVLHSKENWKFPTVPSKRIAQAIKGRAFTFGGGKYLGGTAMLNHALYVRGNRKDYDNWAKNGATGWDWKNVFPYFLRNEDNRNPEIVNNGFHGVGGELNIEYPPFRSPMVKGYLGAANAIGYPIGDFNAASQTVFMPPQGTVRRGTRWSTLQAFIEPIVGRRNLRIITSAYVTKILIDDHKRAYGVLFDHCNKTFKAIAKREVIISAGAFKSPKLLMLSGIGPKEVLQKFQIPVVSDLPVGNNFIDHISTLGLIFIVNTFTFNEKRITKEDFQAILINGTGPLTPLGGIETLGFVNTKYSKDLNWPDMEIFWVTRSASSDSSIRKTANAIDKLDKIFEKYSHLDTVTCVPNPTRIKSKGVLTLQSSDPYENPLIDPMYFSHPDDLKLAVEGLKICLQMASTKPMKKLGVRPLPYVMPGCEKYKVFSDEYLGCMLKAFPLSGHHFAGTCKMGHPNDPTTVVDPTLKVKGVQNLRVVDASIIPIMIGGHTNIPTMMIAEKAADFILYDYFSKAK
ncbi:glucose dehydrogenase [FAD, quinone]-like [Centruroides vittatus]|uniref:glucose dehydrogenase [FAD, quinone]-like n=1 Tax=Centruroides vittatus TaxID=120091 RepID=UPI0035103623